MTLRSSLGRYQPDPRPSRHELDAMAGRAWRDHGIAVIRPDDLVNDWLARSLIAILDEKHGKRK